MTNPNENLGTIPTIGSPQIWINQSQDQKNFEKPDVAMFDNAPNDVTAWSFFGKIFIWFMVWACVVALLFATLAFLWSVTKVDTGQATTMLKILLAH